MAAQLTGFMLSGPTLTLSPPGAGASMPSGAQLPNGQVQTGAGFSLWLGQAQVASSGAIPAAQSGGESLPQEGMRLPPFPAKGGNALDTGLGARKGRDAGLDARLKAGNEENSVTPGWVVNSNNLKLDLSESDLNLSQSPQVSEGLSGADLLSLLALQSPQEGDADSERDALSNALMRLLELLNDESWQLEGDETLITTDMSVREKLAEILERLRALLEDSEGESKGVDADLLQALFKDFDTRDLQNELSAEQLARIEVALQQLSQALQQALLAQPVPEDILADSRMLAREALEKVLELLSERLAQMRQQGDDARERGAASTVASIDAQVDRQQEALIQAQAKNTADAAKADGLQVTPLVAPSDKKSAEADSKPQALGVSRTPESLQSSSTPPPLHERQAPLPTTPEPQGERTRAPFVDQLIPQDRNIDQRSVAETLKQGDTPQQQPVRLESGLTATPAQSTMAANSVPADATTAAKQAALAQQLLNPTWGRALGERAIMMTQQGPRFAEIRLDPPELGALKIRVHLLPGDQVSLSFNSPNAAVRDALEQNMPRLREMFAEQGLNLMDSSVSDQAQEDKSRQNAQRSGDYKSGDESEDLTDQSGQKGRRLGLVDYYA